MRDTGFLKNISDKVKGKYLPAADGHYRSGQGINGETWSAFTAGEKVFSPWMDVNSYDYLYLFTRRYGSAEPSRLGIETRFTSDNFGRISEADVYNDQGSEIDEIPHNIRFDTSTDFAVIDVRGFNKFRLFYIDSIEHNGSLSGDTITFTFYQSNKLPFSLADNALKETALTTVENQESSITNQKKLYGKIHTNLYKENDRVDGQRLNDSGGFSTVSDASWTGYIPVESGRRYSRNKVDNGGTASLRSVWFFDENKQVISNTNDTEGAHRALDFTTPDNCEFIGTNVLVDSLSEDLRFELKIQLTSVIATNNILEDIYNAVNKEESDTPLNRDSKVSVYSNYKGYGVRAMLDDYILVGGPGTYRVLTDGWDSDPVSINPPATHQPMFVRMSPTRVRLLFVSDDGKIFHNYADGTDIDSWAESSVWGLPNTLNPNSGATKTFNGKERPEFYLPSSADKRAAFNYMGGLIHKVQYSITQEGAQYLYWGTYSTGSATPISLFQTEDGKDIYVQYQYGIVPSDNSESMGFDIDFTAITDTIPSDLSLRKRTSNVPVKTNPEPVDVFTYGLEISVSQIVDETGRTKVTASGHGLESGEVIHFKSGTNTENNNNWIAPTSFSNIINNSATTAWNGDTPPGGNGKFYQVDVIDNDSFYLMEALGNPHNHLYTRHIHSVDAVRDGLVISTGEEFKLSNLTFIRTNNMFFLDPNKRMILGDYEQLHLTANPEDPNSEGGGSIQRGLGFYMDSDGFIFASDTQMFTINENLPNGRSEALRFATSGVYKGTFDQIDDWASVDCVLGEVSSIYMFKKMGNIFIVCDQHGKTYYSEDGIDWKFLYKFPNPLLKPLGYSRDRTEFVISNYLFRVK